MGGGGFGGGFRQLSVGASSVGAGGFTGGTPPPARVVFINDFVRIGQSLEALLWAFVGGWTARFLSSARGPHAPGPSQPGAPEPSPPA